MVSRNVSRLERLRTPPPWVRGFYVVVLALGVIGNFALITFSWASHGGARNYALLAFLGILAIVALLFLLRLWRATVRPRRQL
jgi:hypothetical protein